MSKERLKNFSYRVICGFLLGISVVAPGISGSVMAIMLGVYDRLISIAANPFKRIKASVFYLFPMGIGAGISLFLFVILFKFLFENYPTPTYVLFISLILGSLPAIVKKTASEPFKKRYIIAVAAAFIITMALGLVERNEFIFTLTMDNLLYLSFCGAVAGAVSVIPGVSVTIILMLFGVYETLLAKAAGLDLPVLALVGLCFVMGLVLFSRVVNHVFRRHSVFGFWAVLGLMAGSIVGIVPAVPSGAAEWLLCIAMLTIGFGLSVLFGRLGRILKIEEQ